MIGEHDKEIDGLLRRLAKTESSAVRVPAGGHIDADEISVFAENALPERAKARVTAHLADCTRCRTIFSNVVALRSAESADEAEAPAGAAISLEIPWYRKLFAVRNVATALGVLVVMFAGVFAIFLIRNLGGPGAESVAQLENANVADSESGERDSNLAKAPAAEVPAPELAANDAAEPAAESAPDPAASPASEKDIALGRSTDGRLEKNADEEFRTRRRADVATGTGAGRAVADSVVASPGVAREAPATVPAPPPPPARAAQKAAPTGLEMAEAERAEDKDDAKPKVALAANVPEKKEVTLSRKIGGKTFNQRNNVWYDSSYSGQSTINVRRRSAAYRALDAGLRDITEKLAGTVVVVWKEKAYRID